MRKSIRVKERRSQRVAAHATRLADEGGEVLPDELAYVHHIHTQGGGEQVFHPGDAMGDSPGRVSPAVITFHQQALAWHLGAEERATSDGGMDREVAAQLHCPAGLGGGARPPVQDGGNDRGALELIQNEGGGPETVNANQARVTGSVAQDSTEGLQLEVEREVVGHIQADLTDHGRAGSQLSEEMGVEGLLGDQFAGVTANTEGDERLSVRRSALRPRPARGSWPARGRPGRARGRYGAGRGGHGRRGWGGRA